MSKIVRLQAENIMRLIAVDIAPEGNLITVGGKNSAGKSSVLNAIAMVLGGKDLCPDEPIRKGESEGFAELDMGDFVARRRFTRERGVCTCVPPGPYVTAEEATAYQEAVQNEALDTHQAECARHQFAETKSTLTVVSKDGARYPSPQAMLDKLLGRLTFDPLDFLRDKDQAATLRALVGLDVTPFEKARAEAAAKRASLKKQHDIKAAQLLGLPEHKDVGLVELSMDEVSKAMLDAETLRKAAENEERNVERIKTDVDVVNRNLETALADVEELQAEVDKAIAHGKALADHLQTRLADLSDAQDAAAIAHALVPDVKSIRQQLADVESTNIKVRANLKRQEAEKEIAELKGQAAQQDALVKKADASKKTALETARFPIEGLSVSDDTVTYNGLPLSQASSSEQLRISTAIAIALNPTLRVLLVRNGNLLDDDGLAALAKQAEDAGAQVWCEYVASNAGEVSVFIEEGRVKV